MIACPVDIQQPRIIFFDVAGKKVLIDTTSKKEIKKKKH